MCLPIVEGNYLLATELKGGVLNIAEKSCFFSKIFVKTDLLLVKCLINGPEILGNKLIWVLLYKET